MHPDKHSLHKQSKQNFLKLPIVKIKQRTVMALELENDWKNTQQSRENTPPETRNTKNQTTCCCPF